MTIGLPVPSENNKIIRRGYSIVSHPENKKFFELVVRLVKNPVPGRLTTQLFNAKVGDEVKWLKPTGVALSINEKLPNDEKDDKRIICIGGGIGVTPFVSFARHLHDVGDKREIVVLHGTSYVDELSYHEMFTDLEDKSKENGNSQWNFQYHPAISRPQEPLNRSWGGHIGRVESFLKPNGNRPSKLEEIVGEKVTPENTIFYICGWQGTVNGCIEYILLNGFVTKDNKQDDGGYDIKYESYG